MEGSTEGCDRKVIHCILSLLAETNSVLPENILKNFANEFGIPLPFENVNVNVDVNVNVFTNPLAEKALNYRDFCVLRSDVSL